jgi:hypothetical protein
MTEDLTPRVGDVWRFTFSDGAISDVLVTRSHIFIQYPGEPIYEPDDFRDLMSRKDVPKRLLYRIPYSHYYLPDGQYLREKP